METQPTTRKARMTKYLAVEACIALVLLAICPRVSAQSVRTGSDAYGDWRTDAPGVMRRITPADLPAPGETPSTANRSKVVPKPANATLKTMPGFSVDALVTGMQGARVLRVAPNGDIFLALSRPEGKIVTIRTGTDMSNPKCRNLRHRATGRVWDRLLSAGPRPEMGLCRRIRKSCAVSLSKRRPHSLRCSRDDRVEPRYRRQPLDPRRRLFARWQNHVRRRWFGEQRR